MGVGVTNDDDLQPGSGADDPWAPGGAMSATPIPPPPRFFERDQRDQRGERGDRGAHGAHGRELGEHPAVDAADDRVDESGVAGVTLPRAAQIAIGIAVVVALVVAGVWLSGGDRPDAEPAADVAPTSSSADAPTTTATEPVAAPADTTAADVGDAALVDAGTPLIDAVIDLPAEVSSLAPAELVVLTGSGQVVGVNSATGVVASAVWDVPFNAPHLSATDNAMVVWSRGGDAIVVGRRGEKGVLLEIAGSVESVVAESDDEFLIRSYGAGGPQELRLDPTVRTALVDLGEGEPLSARAHPNGGLMVSAADGTYLVTADGSERISGGYVVAEGRNHVLFRDCSGGSGCVFVIDDVGAGTQTELTAIADDDIEPGASSIWLSPDGTAVAEIAFTDAGEVVRFRELPGGEALDVPFDPTPLPPVLIWAPDSSGVYAVTGGSAAFRSRTSGQVTELTALTDLLAPAGGVLELAVRPAPPPADGGGQAVLDQSDAPAIDLVGLTDDGDVLRIDLASGEYTTDEGLPLLSAGSRLLFADETGVTVASVADVAGFRLDYGAAPRPTDGDAISGHVFAGPRPGTLWQSPQLPLGAADFELIDLNGAPLGEQIQVDDAFALGSDGAGGLIVIAVGGNYVATPEGATRLTTGELLATGPTTVYARECDEVLTCGVVRIDRDTGERSPVDDPTLASAPLYQEILQLSGRTVSPDGDVVFVQVSPNALAWAIVDVAAGVTVEVPGPRDASSVVWSDDSRFAVYLSGGQLRVYDRAAGALTTVGDMPDLRAFAEAA